MWKQQKHSKGKADTIRVRDALKLDSGKREKMSGGNAEEFWNVGEIKDSGNIFMLVYIMHILLQGHLWLCFFYCLHSFTS